MTSIYGRYEKTRQETMLSADILRNLLNARPALVKLQQPGKEYTPLIDALLAVDKDEALPTNQALLKQLRISLPNLRSWIETLYADFQEAARINAGFLDFPKVEHQFLIYGARDVVSFSCNLRETPRIGEEIGLPFVSSQAGVSPYYVHEVRRVIFDDIEQVTIVLRTNKPSPYLDMLQSRALAEGIITNEKIETMWPHELSAWLIKTYYTSLPEYEAKASVLVATQQRKSQVVFEYYWRSARIN